MREKMVGQTYSTSFALYVKFAVMVVAMQMVLKRLICPILYF